MSEPPAGGRRGRFCRLVVPSRLPAPGRDAESGRPPAAEPEDGREDRVSGRPEDAGPEDRVSDRAEDAGREGERSLPFGSPALPDEGLRPAVRLRSRETSLRPTGESRRAEARGPEAAGLRPPEAAPPTEPGRLLPAGVPGDDARPRAAPRPAGDGRLEGAGLPAGGLPGLREGGVGFIPPDYRPGPNPDSMRSTALLSGMKSANEGRSASESSPIRSRKTWDVP